MDKSRQRKPLSFHCPESRIAQEQSSPARFTCSLHKVDRYRTPEHTANDRLRQFSKGAVRAKAATLPQEPQRGIRNSSPPVSNCGRDQSYTRETWRASGVVLRTLQRRPLASITTILSALQLVACARRLLQTCEFVEAINTLIPAPRKHCNANSEAQIPEADVDILKLCAGLLRVDKDGNVDFCHKGAREFVSSAQFRQQYGLRSADEVLVAVCIQHLSCHRDAAQTPSTNVCQIRGRKICRLRDYAVANWHEHYVSVDRNENRRINALLHRAILSSLPGGSQPRLDCRSYCNQVLAMGLQMAAVHNLPMIGKTYIEMGALVNPCNHALQTALHVATARSNLETVKLLLLKGADVDAVAQDRAGDVSCGQLRDSASPPDPLLSGCLEHRGCHCWRCCDCMSGRTPLHLAACNGQVDVLKVLVAAGADVNASTVKDCNTALHLAAKTGNIDAVQLLIEAGAKLQAQNSAAQTALQVALQEHHLPVAELLASVTSAADLEPLIDTLYVETGPHEPHQIGPDLHLSDEQNLMIHIQKAHLPVWSLQALSLEDGPSGCLPGVDLDQSGAAHILALCNGCDQDSNHAEDWVLVDETTD